MKKRAIALFSGGLDSLLAPAIMIKQGIEVIGFHCVLPSVDPEVPYEALPATKFAKQIDLPLVYYRCDDEYARIIAHPKHGYGKNANPCIDCKIFFLKKAKELLKEYDASFIVTGDVVGQRPMSQYKTMLRHIEKESGLEGLIVRPLSAKLLPPTIPEREGIVSREALYDIAGRSRSRQYELAAQFGITKFQSPAGGCFLTMPHIASRVKDLIAHQPFSALDLFLANVGRHYRISPQATIIVARNEKECAILLRYKDSADFFCEPLFKGPVIYGRGMIDKKDAELIARVMARYGRPTSTENQCIVYVKGKSTFVVEAMDPIDDTKLSAMRL